MLEKIDGNMPIYANLQKNRNGLKAGKYEVFEYDQGAIRMPRQHMPFSHGGVCSKRYDKEAWT